jgi:hypothetical protein
MKNMTQKIRFILVKLFLFVFVVCFATILGQFALAQEEDYAWVLVNEVDDRGIDDLNKLEARLKAYEGTGVKSEVSSSLNNTGYYVDYSARTTIIGQTSSAQATISTLPLEIIPDKPVELNLRVAITENESGEAGASASVMFCGKNSTLQQFIAPTLGGKPFYMNQFTSEAGKNLFSLNSVDGYGPYDVTVSGSLPAGTVHGEVMSVCAEAFLVGIKMGTVYTYRWLQSGSGQVSGINDKYEVPKDENGDYVDSGVRVSDISGEVLVRRGDASSVEWEWLDVGSVIYVGDMIYTKDRNSHCIISLTDLTTFDMRPRSALIMDTMSEKESKIKLLAGKVLANVKKMIKDGSMNVEMSQAVAGIKGTILILETDDTVSSVNVLEGRVEVRDKNGRAVELDQNEKIVVKDGQTGNKESFALKDELSAWEAETRNRIISEITARTGQAEDLATAPVIAAPYSSQETEATAINKEKKSPYLYLLIITMPFVLGIGFWLKKKKA